MELDFSDASKYSKIYYIMLHNPVIMRTRNNHPPPPSLSFSYWTHLVNSSPSIVIYTNLWKKDLIYKTIIYKKMNINGYKYRSIVKIQIYI